jgi:hypothetical protein
MPLTLIYIHQQDQPKSHIFYEYASRGIRNLGFDTCQPPQSPQPPMLLQPHSTYPDSTSLENYLYTAGSLDGVCKITPCNYNLNGRMMITGLLLIDALGHKSCVGHIRLDYLHRGATIELSENDNLWLGFRTDLDGSHVYAIGKYLPERTQDLVWLEYPMKGRLEWWFSSRQCQVHHNGRASP